jgi:hypothetical protein
MAGLTAAPADGWAEADSAAVLAAVGTGAIFMIIQAMTTSTAAVTPVSSQSIRLCRR